MYSIEKRTMRRSLLLLTFIFLFCSSLVAQIFRFGVPNLEDYDMQRFHWGFSLGLDIVDVNLKTRTSYQGLSPNPENELMQIRSKPGFAFNVGIVANMRMGKYFDLRFIPGFSFSHEIDLYYRFEKPISIPGKPRNTPKEEITIKIGGEYVNFPLLLKFKSSRMHNVRIFALTGGQFSVNMTSAKNRKIKKSDHEVLADMIPIIKPYDVQVKGGFGFDFYTTYFKFTTEFKVAFGVINMLESNIKNNDATILDDYWKSPNIIGLQSLKSKTFTISFIIE